MRSLTLFLFATLLLFASTGRAAEDASTPPTEAEPGMSRSDAQERAQRISEHARASVVDGSFQVDLFTRLLREDGIRMDGQNFPVVLQSLRGLALQPGTEVAVYERLVRARETAAEALGQGEPDAPGTIAGLMNELVEGGLLREAEAADLLEQVREAAADPSTETYHGVALDDQGNWIPREGSVILFSGDQATLEALVGEGSDRIRIVSSRELETMTAEGPTMTEQLADRRERANQRILEAEKREEIPTHGSLGQAITSWMFLGGHEELN